LTLIECKNCSKIVPKTQTCVYCGKPILFKFVKKRMTRNEFKQMKLQVARARARLKR